MFLAYDEGSLHMQNYNYLYAVATIFAIMVNIQTHRQMDRHRDRQHFDQLIQIAQPSELKIFQKSTKNIKHS